MIDLSIDIARGPLFRICLTVLVLGLAYRFIVTSLQIVGSWWRAGDKRLPISDIVTATLTWLVPVRLLSQRPVYGIASVIFHIGMLITPLSPPDAPTISHKAGTARRRLLLTCIS